MRVRRPVGKRPGIQQPRPRPFQPGVIVDPARPRPIGPRPVFDPRTINPGRPGIQQPIPRGGIRPEQVLPIQPGSINPAQVLPPMQPSSQIDPSSPRNLIFANPVGPMQGLGVGDPRTGAAFIPGNRMQEMMRGPQQAASVQPVPAMKKGGVVRGGRAEIKGLRPAKLT